MRNKQHKSITYTIIDIRIYYKLALARIKNLEVIHVDHKIL